MGFTALNQVSAITAQRSLANTARLQEQALTRLSTGLRINRAADDAAGLALSAGLRADLRAVQQGVRNANDAVSLVQVTEGALQEADTLLIRLRELAEQAASGTSGVDGGQEHLSLHQEAEALLTELDRMGESTTYLGRKVLQDVSISVEAGIPSGPAGRIVVDTGGTAGLTIGQAGLGLTGLDLTTVASARDALDVITSAHDAVTGLQSELGAVQVRLESAARNQAAIAEQLTSAESRIRDADVAAEVVALTKTEILTQSGMSALAQANERSQVLMELLRL
ncbi:MAG: flagellin [Acidobacteriota bacterium]